MIRISLNVKSQGTKISMFFPKHYRRKEIVSGGHDKENLF